MGIILPYPCSIPQYLLVLQYFRLFQMIKGIFYMAIRSLNYLMRTKQMDWKRIYLECNELESHEILEQDFAPTIYPKPQTQNLIKS